MITMNFVLLILSFFTLSFAHAQFLLDPQKTGFKQFRFFPPTWEGNYLIPNENNPDAMSPALKNAPSGIYLTVGTERSFFGVALADNISHLLVVDLDPQVKTYNEINRSFLIYTDSPEQLTLMKFSRNYDDWQIMKEELIRRGYSLEASVLNLENFRKYKNTIWGSPNGSDNQLKIFFEPDSKNNKLVEANYLVDKSKFQKLKKMAEARRMQFEIGNFADTQFIAALANSIQDAQLKIGVIDLSNMYIGYMGPRNLADTLSELSRVAHKNTILLGTMLTFSAYFYTNTWVERLGSSYHLSRFISYIDKYSKHYAADIMIGKSKSPDIASELKQFNDFEIEFSLHKSEANHLIHLEFVSSCQKFFL